MMNAKQQAAMDSLNEHLKSGLTSTFHAKAITPVGSSVLVQGFVGQRAESQRWFEDSYSALIGPRGGVRIVEAPRWFVEEWNGKRWCRFAVKVFMR